MAIPHENSVKIKDGQFVAYIDGVEYPVTWKRIPEVETPREETDLDREIFRLILGREMTDAT